MRFYFLFPSNGDAYSCRVVRPSVCLDYNSATNGWNFIQTSYEAPIPRGIAHIDNMFRFSDFPQSYATFQALYRNISQKLLSGNQQNFMSFSTKRSCANWRHVPVQWFFEKLCPLSSLLLEYFTDTSKLSWEALLPR